MEVCTLSVMLFLAAIVNVCWAALSQSLVFGRPQVHWSLLGLANLLVCLVSAGSVLLTWYIATNNVCG
jgi:hypothetical protein